MATYASYAMATYASLCHGDLKVAATSAAVRPQSTTESRGPKQQVRATCFTNWGGGFSFSATGRPRKFPPEAVTNVN